MSDLIQRMKTRLRRVGDLLSGRDVHVEGAAPERLDARATARPLLDVFESDDELLLAADVPGAIPDSTHLYVQEGRLTLLARIARPSDGHRLLGGASDRDWYAELRLPDIVDAERVHAALEAGVIEVHLPKRARPEARRVRVASAT